MEIVCGGRISVLEGVDDDDIVWCCCCCCYYCISSYAAIRSHSIVLLLHPHIVCLLINNSPVTIYVIFICYQSPSFGHLTTSIHTMNCSFIPPPTVTILNPLSPPTTSPTCTTWRQCKLFRPLFIWATFVLDGNSTSNGNWRSFLNGPFFPSYIQLLLLLFPYTALLACLPACPSPRECLRLYTIRSIVAIKVNILLWFERQAALAAASTATPFLCNFIPYFLLSAALTAPKKDLTSCFLDPAHPRTNKMKTLGVVYYSRTDLILVHRRSSWINFFYINKISVSCFTKV